MSDEVEVPLFDIINAVGETRDASLIGGLVDKVMKERGVPTHDAVNLIMASAIINHENVGKIPKALKAFTELTSKEHGGFSLEEILGDDADKYIGKAVAEIQGSGNEVDGAKFISGLMNTVIVATEAKKRKLNRGENGAPSADEIQKTLQLMRENKARQEKPRLIKRRGFFYPF
jgi:hypothetical protein